jgi:stage V sporulation protein B
LSQVEIARRSTRGSFALFAGNFITTVVSFVAIVFIARLLGPGNYGVYTLSILIPNILLNVLGLGVNSGITRYAALHISQGRPEVARRMTVNGVAFVVAFGVVLSGASFVGAGFLSSFVLNRPEIASLVRFASLIILAQAVFQAGVSALLGWSYMGYIGLTNIFQSVLRLAIAVPLVAVGFAVFGALVGYVASVSLGGLFALILLTSKMAGAKSRPLEGFGTDVRTMLSYGRTLFVGQFATSITTQFVVVILASIASDASVGYYQSANNFVTAITITSGSIAQALFPAFAHLEGTKGDLNRAFAYATKYMAFVLTPIIFLLMGASVQIIRVPLTASYDAASGYLFLLALSNIPLLIGYGVLPSFFNGVGRPRYYMACSLAAAFVLLALAPSLSIGAGLGVSGLIYSILLSNLVGAAFGLYLSSRYFGARIDWGAALSILLSSVAAFLVVLPLEFSRFNDYAVLVLEIVVFAAVYLTAAPLLRAIRPADLEILDSALSGLGGFKILVLPVLRYERFVMRHLRAATRDPA